MCSIARVRFYWGRIARRDPENDGVVGFSARIGGGYCYCEGKDDMIL